MDAKYFYLIQIIFGYTLKILALILGFILVKMGKELINDGIKGKFTFKADIKGFRADLYSASPGLLFLLIGAFVIIFTICTNKKFNYSETTSHSPTIELKHNIPPDSLINE